LLQIAWIEHPVSFHQHASYQFSSRAVPHSFQTINFSFNIINAMHSLLLHIISDLISSNSHLIYFLSTIHRVRLQQACRPTYLSTVFCLFIKPPPPVCAGGGYMFSGPSSVPRSVRPSVIHVVVLCFRDISSIC